MWLLSLSELLGLLVPLKEELLRALAVDRNELRVEVGRLVSKRLVAPRRYIRIIERQLHRNLAFLLPLFELLGCGGLNRSLHLLDLLTVKRQIVKHLPLLGRTAVEVLFLLSDLLRANQIFDPVLELDEDLAGFRIIQEPVCTTVTPLGEDRLVVVVEGRHVV